MGPTKRVSVSKRTGELLSRFKEFVAATNETLLSYGGDIAEIRQAARRLMEDVQGLKRAVRVLQEHSYGMIALGDVPEKMKPVLLNLAQQIATSSGIPVPTSWEACPVGVRSAAAEALFEVMGRNVEQQLAAREKQGQAPTGPAPKAAAAGAPRVEEAPPGPVRDILHARNQREEEAVRIYQDARKRGVSFEEAVEANMFNLPAGAVVR